MKKQTVIFASKENLTAEQFLRVKEELNQVWPKDLPRPIIIERLDVHVVESGEDTKEPAPENHWPWAVMWAVIFICLSTCTAITSDKKGFNVLLCGDNCQAAKTQGM